MILIQDYQLFHKIPCSTRVSTVSFTKHRNRMILIKIFSQDFGTYCLTGQVNSLYLANTAENIKQAMPHYANEPVCTRQSKG